MAITTVDAGPRKVSRSIDVQAPADELFDMVADPHRHGDLDGSGTVLGSVEGPHLLSKDATFSVKMKQYGMAYRITSRVTETFDYSHVSAVKAKGLELTGHRGKNGAGISSTLTNLAARYSVTPG